MKTSVETEFLNIKQAAAFLNVSEVSLRRWTNAGTLPCLRVGAKRERRFRRADLIGFMAQDGTPSALSGTSSTLSSGVVLEGIPIAPGSHLCTVYRNDLGRLKLSVPFLADGLAAGQVCFLVARAASREKILDRLRQVRPKVDADIAAGRLILSGGSPSLEGFCDDLADQFVTALGAGARSLRHLGDMDWHRDFGISDEELMEFESRYERQIARRFPVVALCQYDARECSGPTVLDVLAHHQDTFRYPVARFLG